VSGPSSRPKAFRDAAAFREWLRSHHHTRRELVLRCAKPGGGGRGVTYRQALDEALCFGWIDGVRHAIDARSFAVRFTPRTPDSAWSRVNLERFGELRAQGRVEAPGLAAYGRRTPPACSYESRVQELAPSYVKRLRARPRAWAWLQAQPPWYRRTSAFWVMSAKREETRERRFTILLAHSARGEPIPPLRRGPAVRPAPPRARRRR
jgi:uncharacterized protein YdeI (YjbR/CyaY-like superfamily)